jgi:NAD(P)H-dependent FMN reductase
MTITIRSSSLGALTDPAVFRKELAPGNAVELIDVGAVVARREDIHALADQLAEEELLEEMSSYRKRVTGIDNTIWISPKGKTRHGPRLKVAIDPPDTVDPGGKSASISIADGSLVAGDVPASLLKQVQRFIEANRDVLVEYWDYKISTDEMEQRLKKV